MAIRLYCIGIYLGRVVSVNSRHTAALVRPRTACASFGRAVSCLSDAPANSAVQDVHIRDISQTRFSSTSALLLAVP